MKHTVLQGRTSIVSGAAVYTGTVKVAAVLPLGSLAVEQAFVTTRVHYKRGQIAPT